MSEVITSIIQKVKNALDISDDLSSTELYDRLFNYRNAVHPDKFVDEDAKKEAEEKFKNISNLLGELSKHIQQETIQKKPSELIVIKNELELVNSKQLSIDYEAKIQTLEITLRSKEEEIITLKKNVKSLENKQIDQKTQELIKHYQTSKPGFFRLGIAFVFSLAMAVITKVDEIAKFLLKYSPVDPKLINTGIFAVVLLIPLIYLKSYYESREVEYIAKKIKTPKFLNKFMEHLKANNLNDTFSELDVYQFLSNELIPKFSLTNLFFTKVFAIYTDTTIDTLKDIFIYNLYNKQFIYISVSKALDRTFRISNYRAYSSNLEDDDLPF